MPRLRRATSTTCSASRASAELSTRPDNKLGTDEQWDRTEGALEAALERNELRVHDREGEGAFYGPKIDLHMDDALGRTWQMGTIQLDCQMPARFGLTLRRRRQRGAHPVVIHRALFGSLERFIGILIEHYGGAFPFWLAPVQIRILPVGEGHREAADALAAKLGGYRVEVDAPTRRRQADPQRRGGEDPLRDRLRRQGVRRLARRPRARRQAAHDPLSELQKELATLTV